MRRFFAIYEGKTFWVNEDGSTAGITLQDAAAINTLLDKVKRLHSALQKAEAEARRYAESYPRSSDGWNTFIILADRIAELAKEEGSVA